MWLAPAWASVTPLLFLWTAFLSPRLISLSVVFVMAETLQCCLKCDPIQNCFHTHFLTSSDNPDVTVTCGTFAYLFKKKKKVSSSKSDLMLSQKFGLIPVLGMRLVYVICKYVSQWSVVCVVVFFGGFHCGLFSSNLYFLLQTMKTGRFQENVAWTTASGAKPSTSCSFSLESQIETSRIVTRTRLN